MAMLLPSPKSSNETNGAIYITVLHNNKMGWELGMPFFGNVGMVYSRVAARNRVLEPSSPKILKDLMLIKTGRCNFY